MKVSRIRRVSMAGFTLTQKKATAGAWETAGELFIRGIRFRPRRGGFEAVVDAAQVLHALGFHPLLKSGGSATDEYADAIFPGGAPTENSGKTDASFKGQLEGFGKCAIAYTSGKEEKRFGGCRRGTTEKVQSFGAGVHEISVRRVRR